MEAKEIQRRLAILKEKIKRMNSASAKVISKVNERVKKREYELIYTQAKRMNNYYKQYYADLYFLREKMYVQESFARRNLQTFPKEAQTLYKYFMTTTVTLAALKHISDSLQEMKTNARYVHINKDTYISQNVRSFMAHKKELDNEIAMMEKELKIKF